MGKSKETFLLLEHAAGYCVAVVKEWDVIAQDIKRVQAQLKDGAGFSSIVAARGWLPFKNASEALENIQAIRDGEPTDTLLAFLAQTLPKKAKKYQLGVSDSDLAKNLAKKAELPAFHGKDVNELIRCCRMHMKKLVPSLDDATARVFQVGLGHSYSRSKIKSDPARQDKNAQQAVALIEMMDKVTNKFAMRVREWYGWHFPELLKIVNDNQKFARCALLIRVRDDFDFEAKKEELLDVLDGSEDLVAQIGAALKSTMGQEICEADMINIENFGRQVIRIAEQRKSLGDYLGDKLEIVAPNLKELTGDVLAAKLITQAGGLTNLAKAPSSTIQILGAEKALFRALKARGPTPKYGLLFQSSFIGRASAKHKGRISRFLANKIAVASRLDAFSDNRSRIFGSHLREQVEERLRFLTEGTVPRKNLEVMKLASKEIVNDS